MEKRASYSFIAQVVMGAFVFVLAEVILEVHFPGTDIFLFKEAGVNLATRGKFVASNLPHMPFGEERAFAYYPPLYPFLYGVWSWLVGVGIKQSILFDGVLKVVRTLLMLLFIVPLLPKEFFSKKERVFRRVLGTLFCLLPLASTDRDRPDELALVFGLLLMTMLNSRLSQKVKIAVGGFVLACVGATSPAAGIFFGFLAFVWALRLPQSLRTLFGLAISTSFFWGAFLFPVFLQDLDSGARFGKQVGLSTFPYLRFTSWDTPWKTIGSSFIHYWNIFRATSPQFSWLAFTLGGVFAVSVLRRKEKVTESLLSSWAFASLCFSCLVPIVWTLQPYYLWFPCSVLMIWLIQDALHENRIRKIASLGLLFSLLSPFWIWEMKCVLNALQVPRGEKRETIRDAVLEQMVPEALLAVNHDQYFTFRDKKAVINLEYWGGDPNLFEYLYVTDLPDSQHLQDRTRQILSTQKEGCFSLVKDFSTKTSLKVLGIPTKYYVRGHGGSLFKNNCKISSHPS